VLWFLAAMIFKRFWVARIARQVCSCGLVLCCLVIGEGFYAAVGGALAAMGWPACSRRLVSVGHRPALRTPSTTPSTPVMS